MALLFTAFIYLSMIVLIAGIFIAMPYITRKNVSFGIGIPANQYHSEEVHKIRRSYAMIGGGISVFLLVATIILGRLLPGESIDLILAPIAMMVLLIAFGTLYLRAYFQMKALKALQSWESQVRDTVVVDTSMHKGNYRVSPLWLISYIVLIGINVLGLIYIYDYLPDQLPIRISFDGVVNQYTNKSMESLMIFPLIEILIAGLFTFIYWMVGRSKQQLDIANPKKSAMQSKINKYRWSGFSVFAGMLLIVTYILMQAFLYGDQKHIWMASIIPMATSVVIIASIMIIAFTTGQSGSKVGDVAGSKDEESTIVREEDRFWKLGTFYYNKKDPALFIEKRFGVGWTFNFARPLTWIMIIALLATIALFTLITSVLLK